MYKCSAGSTSPRNFSGPPHFLLAFQEHPGHAEIFHDFLSKKLVIVKLCLLQRMPGLGSLRPSTPAGLVALFLFAGVLHRGNFHVASGAFSTISVFSFSK